MMHPQQMNGPGYRPVQPPQRPFFVAAAQRAAGLGPDGDKQFVMPRSLASFAPTSSWRSNLFTPEELTHTGQAAAPMDTWEKAASLVGVLGTGLGAYHGYRRTGSIGWAIGWGLLGGLFPIITIPVAFAQGFGRPEPSFRRKAT